MAGDHAYWGGSNRARGEQREFAICMHLPAFTGKAGVRAFVGGPLFVLLQSGASETNRSNDFIHTSSAAFDRCVLYSESFRYKLQFRSRMLYTKARRGVHQVPFNYRLISYISETKGRLHCNFAWTRTLRLSPRSFCSKERRARPSPFFPQWKMIGLAILCLAREKKTLITPSW